MKAEAEAATAAADEAADEVAQLRAQLDEAEVRAKEQEEALEWARLGLAFGGWARATSHAARGGSVDAAMVPPCPRPMLRLSDRCTRAP